jgi:hypothetical protein
VRWALLASAGGAALVIGASAGAGAEEARYFDRVATLPVYLNLPQDADPKGQTVAEIVAATPDGMTLVYTDSPGERVGLLDITDPADPKPGGTIPMGGEPTSVKVVGAHALVAVSTGTRAEPKGHVAVVDLARREVVATCDVQGQPDSVAASPDQRFLAVAVENERDEEVAEGKLPQLPASHLAILELGPDGRPANCAAARTVTLSGIAEVVPEDPEPEFVAVNAANVAALTLQENNHVVLVDLASGKVTGHFSAGAIDLERIDADDDTVIAGTGSKTGLKREPDAIAWLGDDRLVTANEGDYEGGSRGFTVFDTAGKVVHESGNALEHLAMRHGHYPVKRARSKGVEPEGVEVASFGNDRLIFVASERGNFVAVFADRGAGRAPEYLQLLPTGVGPEGLTSIPARGLLAVATETDKAEANLRATVGLYARTAARPAYPTIVSETDPATGAPIGWGALSGLVGDPADPGRLVAVSDSYYGTSRVYGIDVSGAPARITSFVELKKDGKPAAYDLEGVALRPGGGFWVASEGDPTGKNPLTRKSLLLQVAADGTVEREVALPDALDA